MAESLDQALAGTLDERLRAFREAVMQAVGEKLEAHATAVAETVKGEFRAQAEHFAKAVQEQITPTLIQHSAHVDKSIKSQIKDTERHLKVTDQQIETLASRVDMRVEIATICQEITKAITGVQAAEIKVEPVRTRATQHANKRLKKRQEDEEALALLLT